MSYAQAQKLFEERRAAIMLAVDRASEDELKAVERVLGLRKPDEAADVVDRIVEWERRRS